MATTITNSNRFENLNNVCARPIVDLLTINSRVIDIADDPLGAILTNSTYSLNFSQSVSDSCFFRINEVEPIYGTEIDPCAASCLCGGLPNRNTYDSIKCSSSYHSVRRYKAAIALSECRCPTLDGFNLNVMVLLYNVMRGLYLTREDRIMKAIYSSSYVCKKNLSGVGSTTKAEEFYEWTGNPILDASAGLLNRFGLEEIVYEINSSVDEVSDARRRYNAGTTVIIVDKENFNNIRLSMRATVITENEACESDAMMRTVFGSTSPKRWKYLYLSCADVLVVCMPHEKFKVDSTGRPFFPVFSLNALSAVAQPVHPKIFSDIGVSIGANSSYSNEFVNIATLANHNDPDYDGAAKWVAYWGNAEIKVSPLLFSFVLGKAFATHSANQVVGYTGTPVVVKPSIDTNPVFTKAAT